MPRIRSVIPILGVAHYEQISGSLCSRIVAHFTPDYSINYWGNIERRFFHGSGLNHVDNIRVNKNQALALIGF
jgi:hypothetical protein